MSVQMYKTVHRQLSDVFAMLWYSQQCQMTLQWQHLTSIGRSAWCRWHQVSESLIAASCTIWFFSRAYVFRWFHNRNEVICHSIITCWRHLDILRDEADGTCSNSGSLSIYAQHGSFILPVSFLCFGTHDDKVVCTLNLIKPLIVTSYCGRELCIPLSDILLFSRFT